MICPRLYAVVDLEACVRAGHDAGRVATAFVEAGISLLQIRGKTVGASVLLDVTRQAVRQGGARTRVIVNDRPDVALAARAGGVHVGQDDLSPVDVRTILGPAAWVGLSTHSLEQARRALDEPITYLAVGPVFDTGTKDTGYPAAGLTLVRAVADLARPRGLPVVAIGGITLERAPAVLAAGASSVCVISDLLTEEPGARARAFLAAVGTPP